MELIRITDSHNPLLSGVPGLYESAFPAVARIPSKKLLQLIDKEPQMAFNVITVKGKFCGMAIVWDLDKFRYLEYFAMLPHCRCQGIGTEVLGELCRQSSQPIVAEVEPPETDIQRRRIAFYFRNGFHVDSQYPPILNGFHKDNPLWLVASQSLVDSADCQREIIRSVYSKVLYSLNT